MLFLFLLLSLAQENVPQAEADGSACAALRKYEERQRPTLPQMVDEVTRLDRMQVDCPERTMTLHKTLIGDPANLLEGWNERQQESWNEAACGADTFRVMMRYGWRFVQRYSFSDGREIVYEARCS